MFKLIPQVYAEDIIGTINPPGVIPNSVEKTTPFLNVIITFIIVIAGLFTLWQFITGGLSYISSGGDKNKVAEANNKFTFALLGIVLIAGSFIIAGILGMVLFGDFTAILSPKLQSIE